MNDQHRRNTADAGYEIRALYAGHPPAVGSIVVTWSEDQKTILAVTRQDDDGKVLSVIAEAPAVEAQEQPAGAIENGRTLIERLENNYDFACEAGDLRRCSDWNDLKMCFELLAQHVSEAVNGC